MNQPGPVRTVVEATGMPQMHRDAIADTANRAAVYAAQAVELAQLGDDPGLRRAVLMLSLCAAAAVDALPALRQAGDAERRLMAAASAAGTPSRPVT